MRKVLGVTMFVLAIAIVVGSAVSPLLLEPVGYAYSGKALMDKAEY